MTDRWDWPGRPLIRNGWTIRKEFYADGPSMFVWVAERPGGEREEFERRRDALTYAERNTR